MEYSADVFYALLKWLDTDDQRAAEKYEAIRRRLVHFFALRRCSDPEDLTDETISRVALHASKIAASYEGEPSQYLYAVARRVLLENLQKPVHYELPEELRVSDVEKDDRLYDCYNQCMLKLTADERELLLAYHEENKRAKIEARRRLAAQLGITASALRIRVVRTKMILRECAENCMKSHLRKESDKI